MDKLVELAGLVGGETVLEVGPATGSLTEELLTRGRRVVACEIDRDLAELLRQRLGDNPKLTILTGDVLAGKHELAANVVDTLGPAAHLVSNLPYNVATPIVALCLASAWRAAHGAADHCLFERLTFTVQKEVADRFTAAVGTGEYGPISVLIALLGRAQEGPIVPASAFWPRPKISSRILRIDYDPQAAGAVADFDVLDEVVHLAFSQRRKKVGTVFRNHANGEALLAAAAAAGIDTDARAERISPQEFGAIAATLARPKP